VTIATLFFMAVLSSPLILAEKWFRNRRFHNRTQPFRAASRQG